MAVRLDKYLADNSSASRSEARNAVKNGRVSVDGCVVTRPETKVDERSHVEMDGQTIGGSKFVYIMMNKPMGVLSATEDSSQATVIDLLSDDLKGRGLFPVGRLDKDTTGLMLLTNDGAFAHGVISPRRHVKKRYLAETDGTPTSEDAARFENGITLGDGTVCLPASLEMIGANRCIVTVEEGKYHQVKRMLAACRKPVIRLHRLAIGGLELDEQLAAASYRELTQEELDLIFC